jgi:hypothetical protein
MRFQSKPKRKAQILKGVSISCDLMFLQRNVCICWIVKLNGNVKYTFIKTNTSQLVLFTSRSQRPLACWDFEFESRRGYGWMSVVSAACCQVDFLASEWSLVQRNPSECGVSECDREASTLNLRRLTNPYRGRTALLTSKRCILYIYSTNIGTEYFKHGIYSPLFSLQNAGCFIVLTYLVPVLFTFYIQGVLKLKKIPHQKVN